MTTTNSNKEQATPAAFEEAIASAHIAELKRQLSGREAALSIIATCDPSRGIDPALTLREQRDFLWNLISLVKTNADNALKS